MKPESSPGIHSGDEKPAFAEATADGTTADATDTSELSEKERLVLKLLQEKSPIDLNELKGQTGLSNKKWDSKIKGLRLSILQHLACPKSEAAS